MVELGEHDLTGPSEQMATLKKKVKRVVVHKDYKVRSFNRQSVLGFNT